MNTNAIYYGKNINTGAIEQLRSVSNVLLTSAGTLDNLTDVVITTPANNQILKYTSPNWVNGSLILDNLSDVVITSGTTGDILQYNGTNWVNVTQNIVKQYMSFNMFGTTTTNLHANTQPKPIMAGIATYWQNSPPPNPATNTNANMTSTITPFSDVFDTNTGFITLVSTKRYMVTATINQGGVNLNSSTQAQLAIYNASSGTASPFNPNYANIGRMDIDFAGMGITTIAVVSGVSKIAIMFNYLTAQSTGLNPFDTSIAVSILEI